MKRIIVGIDGSAQGWSALSNAAELARVTGAGLRVVHVSLPINALFAAEGFQAAGWAQSQETFATGLLREAAARAKDFTVEVEVLNRTGQPVEVLAELAQSAEVTMVVVGHRGRNLASRLLVGSVADGLVQISSKPVLVIR